MSKEAFFYAYKTLTKEQPYNVFLESGRGGHLSVAAWNPIAVAKSVENGLHIHWRSGEQEVREGEALEELENLVSEYKLPFQQNLPDYPRWSYWFY